MKVYTNEEIKQIKERKQRVLKILRRVFWPIIILAILFCAYVAYQKVIKKEANIQIFGYRAYIVLTGSMEPSINIGDVVIIKKSEKDKIQVGSIITFKADGQETTVTHRIVEILEDNGQPIYITKGDHNNANDPDLVKYENIQGIMLFKVGKIGKIITELLTGTGLIVMIIVIAISYEYSNKKEDRKIAREEARKKYNVYKYKDYEEEK